ncbi:MAG TPA: hypothetical protein VH040_13115 [Usitatibacter sp.]|jgi:hypothetical protein|nr:hypothetical protein [Usitatibacter sp.]
MNATKSLVLAAFAATGLAVGGAAQAANHMSGHMGGGGGWHGGGGNWHGGGAWHGGGGAWHGGWHNHVFFGGPRASFWWGWPLAFGPWYWWGYPYDYYYGSYYYPSYPAGDQYPQGVMPPDAQSESAPPVGAPGTPTQGPTYMNYCESAKAYFPKVTTCPEGWKFVPAQPR